MAIIYVDNVAYEVEDGKNLLHACLSLGFDIPYFCWHPAIKSVGACRQCAVMQFRDENDTRGKLVMSCMTPAMNGTRISIDDPEAKAFRASVIEWLMINHPHDCPVCDEGGECHLQDMTLMTGHNYRRYRFKKRTYRNQYLGPFISHEMNRCIQCYRCVRYYRDYADGSDLNVFASRNRVYFGRHTDGILESEFSGNLVEVCPTGVFVDKTFQQHYTRKWDLQTAPSVCVHCGVGCNTIPGERYGTLGRIRNRFNFEVNGYFLCDRGRFGYEFVNSELRIIEPAFRSDRARYKPADPDVEIQRAFLRPEHEGEPGASGGATSVEPPDVAVMRRVGEILRSARGIVGIGSPRASLEANFALTTLAGREGFYQGVTDTERSLVSAILDVLTNGPTPTPSLEQVRRSDAVLVLGEDVTNSAPVLALALRQAAREQPLKVVDELRIPRWQADSANEVLQGDKGPFFIACATATKLDDIATLTYRAAPEEIARLGFAIAGALGAGLPAVEGLPGEVEAMASAIADALMGAERPLVVAGTSYGSEAIVQAAANVAWALTAAGRPAHLAYTVPECNSLGLGMMRGGSLKDAFQAVRDGAADTVVILENDLYRRADAAEVDAFLDGARWVIAIDHLANRTSERVDVVLPAATFAEGDGTFVNNEGRAQRFFQVFQRQSPQYKVQESWRWLQGAMVAAGRTDTGDWANLDDVIAAMARSIPAFGPVVDLAPPATFRIAGQKIARQHARNSGRTAVFAHIDVSEPKPPDDPDSPLTFSMEGFHGEPPAALIPRFWAPGWNSGQQALNKFQSEVGGPLEGGDPGRRLIEPARQVAPLYFRRAPQAFRPRGGEWLVLPLHHIFGSEELSVHTPGVAELSPRPYLALNPADASGLGLADGQEAVVPIGETPRRLAVRLVPELPKGVAGLPAGLPEMWGVELPRWSRLRA